MKKKILVTFTIVILALLVILSGCQTGGISQAQYDQLNAQLSDVQTKLNQLQGDLAKAQAEKSAVDAQLKDAQAQVAALQGQIGQSSLVGATPAETAAKIVKYYHDTHVYSTYDLFICSDMASEVWNMLKAQGISAVIVVGDVHNTIVDILQSNHAWVLADVGSGEKLALETTGGRVVTKSENALYYRGWSFNSPADLKANNDMVKEYNTRVAIRNDINNEANAVAALHNKASNQTEADKYKAIYDKLVEIRTEYETYLNNLMASINALATSLC